VQAGLSQTLTAVIHIRKKHKGSLLHLVLFQWKYITDIIIGDTNLSITTELSLWFKLCVFNKLIQQTAGNIFLRVIGKS